MQNLNVKPYYDDFDSEKGYHKIMFNPGRPIQARELTQIQSILQNQVKNLGDFVLDNGSMVIPGHIFYDNSVFYVKLEASYNSVLSDEVVESFVGRTITGSSSKVQAYCIAAVKSSGSSPAALFIKYTKSGEEDSPELESPKKFKTEVLSAENISETVKVLNSTNNAGTGSVCHIKSGIYYVNGYFVQVDDQSVVLSFNSTPSCRVGLRVDEDFVSVDDDNTLFDNSRGFINRSAPGADRYRIKLTLSTRGLFSEDISEDENNIKFLDLLHVKNGVIQYKVETAKLGELEKTLARRTYDESGDYIVEPFNFTFNDYRSNSRGAWAANTYYLEGDVVYRPGNASDLYTCLSTGSSGSALEALSDGTDAIVSDGVLQWAYTPVPVYNNGAYTSSSSPTTMKEEEAKAVMRFNKGIAYIKGFEVRTNGGDVVEFEKARTYVDSNNASISPEIGSYIEVTNVKGLANFNVAPNAVLYDGQADATPVRIGTCRIRAIELAANSTYKLYIFDVVIDNPKTRYFSETAQIKVLNSVGATLFSCDVQPTLIPLVGTVAVAAGVITGTGTNFSSIRSSSIVRIGTTQETAKRFYIGAINADYKSSSCTPNNVSVAAGANIWLERAVLKGDPKLLVPLPHPFIRTLRYTGNTDTDYSTKRIFYFQATGTSYDLSLTVSGETFAPASGTNYTICKSNTTWSTPSVTVASTLTTATIYGLTGGDSYWVMATVNKKNRAALEKTKTIKRKVVTFYTLDKCDDAVISLGEADVIRIHSIIESTETKFDPSNRTAVVGFAYANSINVTNNYILDGGQRDAYYGLGSIKLKSGMKVASGPIRVTFEYFDHSAGDYFSVDSYATIPYQNIPEYKGIALADVFDFRPRIADNGLDFVSTGSSKSEFVTTTQYVNCDYSYYLGRQDLVVCNTAGEIKIVQGTPSLTPKLPVSNKANEVVLGSITISPYTAYAKNDVVYFPKRIPRYTMADIAKLEKRIENVEEYVALSLEEKATSEMNITDKFGNDRYKNGFFVDVFKDHGSGFSKHPDYSCAVDPTARELRPFADVDSVSLVEETTSNRAALHYTVTGDLVTLPYTKVKVIEQKVASRPEFINPYATFSFFGKCDVFPQQDFWVDTKALPDIIIRKEGNFNSLQTLAQRAGMLGTVWGAWTESGRKTIGNTTKDSSSTVYNLWKPSGYVEGFSGNRPAYYDSTVTTTTAYRIDEVQMKRTGTQTYMEEVWNETDRTTNIISSSITPYIRSRSLIVHITGMKPASNVYMWANKTTNIVMTSATILDITTTGNFIGALDTTSVSDNDTLRNGPGNLPYDRGEVIKNTAGTKSAIVVEQEKVLVNGVTKTYLYVINVLGGPFVTGESIIGLGSKATASINTVPSATTNKTNANGSFFGTALIPGNKFATGQLIIEVNDSAKNAPGDVFTSSEVTYTAQGTLTVTQDTVISVRNGQIAKKTVSDSDKVTQLTQTGSTVTGTSVSNVRYYDPLAETFVIQDEGGAFITDIDLFFYNVETQYPVTVEIREAVNGYPGQKVLPFARKIVSGSAITANATKLVATKFTFPSPVYVKPGQECAIVVMSDSNKTRVWTSRMGEKDITTAKIIDKQPYLGSMFKSQNNSTWTAEQTDDLTFVLYKAKFDTSKTGELVLVNRALPPKKLDQNPFRFTNGSLKVVVNHFNHGFRNGDRVTFSGVIGGTGVIPGQSVTYMNRQWTVSEATYDEYVVTLPASIGAATATGNFGNVNVYATENKEVNNVQIQIGELVLPQTSLNYFYRGWANDWLVTDQWRSSSIPLKLNDPTPINRIMHILSAENENIFSGRKTFMFRAQLASTNANISPVIDLQGAHTIVTTNIINSPSSSNNIVGINESLILNGSTVLFTADDASVFYSVTPSIMTALKKIEIGKVYVMDSATDNDNDKTFTVTNVSYQYSDQTGELTRVTVDTNTTFDTATPSQSVSLVKRNSYINEIAPVGSSAVFKYVSSPMILDNPATGLKLRFAYNMPLGAAIKVYYKTCLTLNDNDLIDNPWIEYVPTTSESFINTANTEQFIDFECNIDELAEFDQCLVKIIGLSNVGYIYPRFKSFRLIALA